MYLRKEPPLHSQEIILDRQPTPQQGRRQLRSVGQTFSHVAALSGHDVLPVAVRSPLNDCLLRAGEQGLCLRLGSVWKWVQGLGRVEVCIPKRPAISSSVFKGCAAHRWPDCCPLPRLLRMTTLEATGQIWLLQGFGCPLTALNANLC